jgi:GAF domain-containing protein
MAELSPEAALGLAPSVSNPRMRNMLSRLVRRHRTSAALLRAHGREAEARRTEQFALRVSLTLEEPLATQQMHELSRAVADSTHHQLLLERALDGALSLIGGDFGNVQIRDPRSGGLRIAAESGFSREFLEYFALVEDEGSACGRAASQRAQTVIADVMKDAAFAPHREIAASSGFRAVQSTPLIDKTGRVCGVVSTHYRRAHRPSVLELQLMEWYGERVGAALARLRRVDGAPAHAS